MMALFMRYCTVSISLAASPHRSCAGRGEGGGGRWQRKTGRQGGHGDVAGQLPAGLGAGCSAGCRAAVDAHV